MLSRLNNGLAVENGNLRYAWFEVQKDAQQFYRCIALRELQVIPGAGRTRRPGAVCAILFSMSDPWALQQHSLLYLVCLIRLSNDCSRRVAAGSLPTPRTNCSIIPARASFHLFCRNKCSQT
jgi:hypothetical protein